MTHFGFLSTYPPTRCGLATFTEALSRALAADEPGDPTIVRILDSRERTPSPPVLGRIAPAAELITGNRLSMRSAVSALNASDVAIIQHRYDIYGGSDGDEIIPLLRSLRTPAIVVLHSVLISPTPHQRVVLETVCRLADTVVVMTDQARNILRTNYSTKDGKVRVIPYGVPVQRTPPPIRTSGTRRMLTWGFLAPDKGIEWGIRAMAALRDLAPAQASTLEYVVAGPTHPKVLARKGEGYRESLQELIVALDLEGSVRLDGRYREAGELAELIADADVVLLPYETRDQAASGVLIEAVAAGVAVVATGFPHAVELLGGGAGIVVEHENPMAMAEAIREVVWTEGAASRMRDAGIRDTRDASWPDVAAQYRDLARRATKAAA